MAIKEDVKKILIKQFTDAIEKVYTDSRVSVITFTITNHYASKTEWREKNVGRD